MGGQTGATCPPAAPAQSDFQAQSQLLNRLIQQQEVNRAVNAPAGANRPGAPTIVSNRFATTTIGPEDIHVEDTLVPPMDEEPFDWESFEEPDPAEQHRRKRLGGRFSQTRQKPGYCTNCPEIIQLLWSLLITCGPFLLIAAIIYFGFNFEKYNLLVSRNGAPLNFRMECIRAMLFMSASIALYLSSVYLIDLAIRTITFLAKNIPFVTISPKMMNLLKYFDSTKRNFGFMFFCAGLMFLSNFLIVDNSAPAMIEVSMNQTAVPANRTIASSNVTSVNSTASIPSNQPNYNLLFYFRRAIYILFVFSLLSAIEKLLMQVIAVEFHKKAFARHIADINRRFNILNQLVRVANQNNVLRFGKVLVRLGNGANGKESEKEKSQDADGGDIYAIRLTEPNPEMHFTKGEANKTAKLLFKYLTDGKSRDYLLKDDFKPLFRGERYLIAFRLFDPEDTGRVSGHRFRETIVDLYRERCDLFQSIEDHGKIVSKLDTIFMAIILVFLAAISMTFFNVSVYAFITSFGAMTLTFTFVFGGCAKLLFDDLVYIFITHSYDVGDSLLLDGDIVVVDKLEIMTTTVIRTSDGQLIYCPTQMLIPKNIFNIRRSGSQSEMFDITLSSTTSSDKLAEFKNAVTKVLAEEHNDFTGKLTFVSMLSSTLGS